MDERPGFAKLRSVFLSDIHLGSRYSQAEPLLAFLHSIQPEYLYLVGDIIDGWRLKQRWHWRPVFSQILSRLIELGKAGTQIRFTPGNHDAFLREFAHDFGFLEIADAFVHETAGGLQYLVLHGDRFDDIELRAQWLSYIGSFAYDTLIWFNGQVNLARGVFRLEPHNFSALIKKRVKQAVTFVSRFEERLACVAQEADCDGVICGHIHTPAVKTTCGLSYFNTGDWIEHRSALVEHQDGRMELINLPNGRQKSIQPGLHRQRRVFEARRSITCTSDSASPSQRSRSKLMARILYSMAGEGRGHAMRVRAIVEALRHEHEIILLASDEAYDFLALKYSLATSNVFVRRIPGLRFHYHRSRLNLAKSLLAGAAFWWQLPTLVDELGELIDEYYPTVAIVDFEPALAQAAFKRGVPVVSLDHQHFLTSCDLSALPLSLRGYAQLMGWVVRALGIRPTATIVSSFFKALFRSGHERVLQVGPLLRPDLRQLSPTRGTHLVSYLRKNTPSRVLEMLASCDRDVHVYGLGERKSDGNLRFREIDEQSFAFDLADCAAVVQGIAGNQTLGEALHFGKPVLALPESHHHEQLINAHFLKSMHAGDWITAESADCKHLSHFLSRLDEFEMQASTHQGRIDGTAQALTEINRFLPQTNRSRQRQYALGAA